MTLDPSLDPFDATLVQQQQQQQTPQASYNFASSNIAAANVASPGAKEMKAAYEVRQLAALFYPKCLCRFTLYYIYTLR